MKKRASQPQPEMIGEILRKILKQKNIPHAATDRRLLDLWRGAVGPQIAARTWPETVKRGGLYVLVSSPAWLHQLQFLKEEILFKLNGLAGQEEFRRLYFSIGELPCPSPEAAHPHPAPHSTPPLRKRDREMIRESLDSIGDLELRDILERVMVKEIRHRREREGRKDL